MAEHAVFDVSSIFWRFSDFRADTWEGDTGKTTFAKQMTMKYTKQSYQTKYVDIARFGFVTD